MKHEYPLKLYFKFLAIAPKVSVTDATGKEIFYIEQKLFALKEAVKVYNNSQEKKLLYTMHANQIIDFSAKYLFYKGDRKEEIGSVQQDGMRSLFQASYTIADKKDKPLYTVVQTNPIIALVDSLLSIIPYIGLLTGFFLNPKYVISGHDKKPLMTMIKKPSFLESTFSITADANDLSENDELAMILSLLMIVQLERNRS